jgi:hypothetical protein
MEATHPSPGIKPVGRELARGNTYSLQSEPELSETKADWGGGMGCLICDRFEEGVAGVGVEADVDFGSDSVGDVADVAARGNGHEGVEAPFSAASSTTAAAL